MVNQSEKVRVRVAPSPTGAMHLGLARTALYNWLFCRAQGGRFVLRIDDTDAGRNLDESLEPILRGLRWLGIEWNEGPGVGGPHAPYFQSQRAERHAAVVELLLERGAAYLDYATAEETRAEREQAIAEKRSTRYSRRWMGDTEARRRQFEAEGRKPVVRLRMPESGTLVLDDLVRGRVEFDWSLEQDHVVRRADGSCLYHLASIVDDHDMDISHIIRAEEHLSNTPRQVFIARALGWALPKFCHLPYVAEPGSKNKLSKRKLEQYARNRDFAELVAIGRKVAPALGLVPDAPALNPVSIEFYELTGFVPAALVNYLALLGWALDDRTEHFERDELARAFTLDRVNRAPASFDPGRLLAFQTRHMLGLAVEARVELVLPFLVRAGLAGEPAGDAERHRVGAILEAAGDRVKVGADILDYRGFFTSDDRLEYDEAAFRKRLLKPGVAELLARFRERLAAQQRFDAASHEDTLNRFVVEAGIKVGDVIHALRVAVTGKAVGFGVFETLAILGRDSSLARIDRALAMAREAGSEDTR
ncbi:glutamate--tRNA ligase [candidate division WOR-3 bacterium]|nr:glutamate--tRNA ligase [candidate division WOR-3 bacterium]